MKIFSEGKCFCEEGFKERMSNFSKPCILEDTCYSLSDCSLSMPVCNSGYCNCSSIYFYNEKTKRCEFPPEKSNTWFYYVAGVVIVLTLFFTLSAGLRVFRKYRR
jgi:hypothetical protein